MPNLVIQALPRQPGTNHALQQGRQQAKVPGVLYGYERQTEAIWVDAAKLQDALRQASSSAILQLELGDAAPAQVMIKEVQYDALTRQPRHVDLQVIDLNAEIEAAIPLQLHGKAVGVKAGGVLQAGIREIEVRGLPADLLPLLSVEIGDLDFGDRIIAADLQLPPGLKLVSNPAQLVATIVTSNTKAQDVPETEVVTAPLVVASQPSKPESEI